MNQMLRQTLTEKDIQKRAAIFSILDEIGEDLDLTETQLERARQNYDAVADWVSGSTNALLGSVQVYPQGSIALGTAVKPIGREEFDVDLICFCAGVASNIAPAILKKAVGDRLRENGTYAPILDEKKRCWRLNYEGDFHLDISPTIANQSCSNGGELVPDRALQTWHPTNPRAYKDLFDERAALKPNLVHKRIVILGDKATVEPFPDRESKKGLLRRMVQLLKRHRDVLYKDNKDDIAPISIIITTLAMRAYEYCVRQRAFQDELDVLIETIRMMPDFIERDQQLYVIQNETTAGENFADNWNKDARLAKEFFTWHRQALSDFEAIRDEVGHDLISRNLKRAFGDRVATQVLDKRVAAVSDARKSETLSVAPAIGLTTSAPAASTAVPKNTFYGDQ